MLQPSGMAVLDRMGLAETVARRGARIDALLGIEEHGRIALDAPYARLGVPDAFGIGIHRASLFGVLYEAVLSQGIEVRTGHEVATSRTSDGGRCLVFSDHTHSYTHDLIVDASGWASRIDEGEQRGLLPFGALWASIPITPDDPHARNLLEQRYRRAAQMVGVLPIGSRSEGAPQEVAFFWSLRRVDHEQWHKTPLGVWKDEVRKLWPQVDFLLDRLTSHDDLTFARYAHRTSRKAHGNRLVRIGDAWHSASPQLGQGANMALLDAWALAAGLREGHSVAEGIRLTTRWRREHVALYQFVTAAFTPMFQSDLALWPWLRDRMMAPLSRFGPVARIQAQLMSGLFGWPLQTLGLDLPDYSALAAAMAARAPSSTPSKC